MMQSPSERLNSIDALRGLAVLMVVLYHARSMLWIGIAQTWRQHGLSGDINAWLGYATAPLSFGGLGVTLFFVLSGYCIHRRGAQRLAVNPVVQLNLKMFYFRRIWRIFPTYFAALCITAIVDAYIINYHPTQVPAGQNNSCFAFWLNLLSLQGLASPTFGSNGVFWTLALELHLYVAYPLLYYISRVYSSVRVLHITFVVGLTYVIFAWLIDLPAMLPYRGAGGPIFLPYWFTWAVGFYIAEVEAGRATFSSRSWVFALLGSIVAIPMLFLKLGELAEFGFALAFGGLLYWSITRQGNCFWSCLSGQLLAKIGLFSYSLYAVHVPCLVLVKAIMTTSGQEFTTLFPTIVGTLLSLAAAWFLFLLVERWSLKPLPQWHVLK